MMDELKPIYDKLDIIIDRQSEVITDIAVIRAQQQIQAQLFAQHVTDDKVLAGKVEGVTTKLAYLGAVGVVIGYCIDHFKILGR